MPPIGGGFRARSSRGTHLSVQRQRSADPWRWAPRFDSIRAGFRGL